MRSATPLVLVAVALAAACASTRGARSPQARGEGGVVRSNVLRADYAGSAACAPCHGAIVAQWDRAPMHNMTRDLPGARVRAPFHGTALRFKDDRVELDQKGDQRFVSVYSRRYGDARYRVTRVIGGHYREDYAGVQVGPGGESHEELILPVSYLIFDGRFRYKGYSVMSHERDGLRAGPVWSKTCILCHNTAPYFTSMLGSLPLPHAKGRRSVYQGEVVDPLLPQDLRWRTVVDDEDGLRDALADDVAFLSGTRPSPGDPRLLDRAIATTRADFDGKKLVEVGIGCESCHGGAKEHVRDPSVAPSFLPHTPFLHVAGDEGDPAAVRAQRINRTCARCHQVLFSRYPYTWEGGLRAQDPGGSNINSGEGRDFLLSKCSMRADCTLCHDPHSPDDKSLTDRLETPAGDAVCTGCHTKYASVAAQRAHTHHDPAREGGRCVACHMPRKNMTLDVRLGRYHRIESPNDPMVLRDRPLECALCHTDKTVGTILDEMDSFWGTHLDRTLQHELYGSLDARPLVATLARGKPHEQAVALRLLGERKDCSVAVLVAGQLTNDYPLVRFYADDALASILGTKSPIDLYATDDAIRAQARRWLESGGVAP